MAFLGARTRLQLFAARRLLFGDSQYETTSPEGTGLPGRLAGVARWTTLDAVVAEGRAEGHRGSPRPDIIPSGAFRLHHR